MAVYERNVKEALFSSLYRLLQLKGIDSISVDEIVGGARVARSTFYRNFRDKYELLQWSYERLLVMTFSTIVEPLSVERMTVMTFEMYRKHRLFFRNGLDSGDPNSLHRALIDTNEEYWRGLLQQIDIDPDADGNMHIIRVYLEGGIARLVEWIHTGMKEDPAEMAQEMLGAIPVRFVGCLALESTALERFT